MRTLIIAAVLAAGTPYPAARVDKTADTLHGVSVADPYRWLEDASNPEVKKWVDAEDELGRSKIEALPITQELKKRYAELYYVGTRSAPSRWGNRWFWTERKPEQEKEVVYWREGKAGAAKVLLDPNAWAADGSLALGDWFISRNGKTCAYQVRKNAADEATLEFVDVATGKHLDKDTIEGAKYTWDLGWARNDDGVYYTWVPPKGSVSDSERPGYAEIRFHKLGTDPKTDKTVQPKTGDATTFVYATTDTDDRYAYYVVRHGWVSRDVYVLDLHDPKAQWKPFVVGHPATYSVWFSYGRFYIRTDEDAPRGRLFSCDPKKIGRENWVEVLPQDPKRALQYVAAAGGKLIAKYLDDVKTTLEVHDPSGKLERTVQLPGIGTADVRGRPEDDEAYLSFSTFFQPEQIFKTSVKKGGLDLYSEVKVPFDPSPYTVEQLFAKSKDGTQVPAFVIHRKDAKQDGSVPLLMYGYGGYGTSVTPAFWSSFVPWLEHGGSAAVANIRGGGEYGEDWHKAGMRLKKQNVFDDFEAVTSLLIEKGYTRADRLAIRGESNGGLLMGAALTQHPELYKAVQCAVPIIDMMRYHLVGAGKTWVQEFGTPDDPDDFKVLYAYSPYHQVKQGTKYPAVLLQSADSDDRVDPMHARKFAAMLQARSAGGPVLFVVQKNAGHAGGDMIKTWVEMRAQGTAFLMHETGLDAPAPAPAK